MSSKSRLYTTVIPCTLLALPHAYAEPNADDLPIINMDTVVVTATQTEEDAFTTAKSVDKVDKEQLDIDQPESVGESVNNLTNVNATQGPRQLSQQVNIRGLGGKEVLQVLDNARQNFQNGHQGSFFIEPELLKEIEVLKGPGSSLWGSGAIGGVVNMTTVDPSDLLEEEQTLGAKVKGGYGSADDLLYTSDSVYGKAGVNNEYLINYTYRDTNNITAGGDKTIPNSAFWDRSGMAKWVANLTDTQTLRLSYIAFDAYQNVPSDPRQDVDGSENPLVDQNIWQQNWNATYDYDNPNNDWLDFTSTFYYNKTDISSTCLGECSENSGGPDREDVTGYNTIGLNARNTSYFSWLALTYGAETYQDSTSGERNNEPREQFPDAKADVWASYIQAEIPFWQNWTLTPGVRYDHFNNRPNQDTVLVDDKPVAISSTSEGDVSSSVTLSWQATAWLSLHAIYDEAFRAPAVDELYASGPHFIIPPRFVNEFIPNPDLKPEKSHNKELSARLGWDNLISTEDQLRMRASVFRNDVENLIQQQVHGTATDGFTIYENVPNARLTGVEFDGTYRICDWFTSLGYGYVQGINEDPVVLQTGAETKYLDGIPPERIILNVGRYFYQDTLLSGVRLTHAWAQEHVSAPQDCAEDAHGTATACPTEAYTTLDLYAAWQPAAKLDNLQVDLAINNITDQYYFLNTTSLLPNEGRNVKLSVSYAF